MSNGSGYMITPPPSTKYTGRSTGKRKWVAYLDPVLAQYGDAYCKANGISRSKLVNLLLAMLKDDL